MEIGIIGAGWWAAQAYIPALQRNPLVSSIAACRPDHEGLQVLRDRLGIAQGFIDAAQMLEERPLAGVIIASPHVLHAEHALLCIGHGLPLLIDKPMATSSADAHRIAEAAQRAGTPVIVSYGWNFDPLAVAAAKLMRDGWIGQLTSGSCNMATATMELFSGQAPPPTKDHLFQPSASTWSDPARAGGYAWGQLTHALGLLFLLVDLPPRGVFARMGFSPADVDSHEAAVVELANGASIAVSGTAALPRARRRQLEIRLFGTEGVLLLDFERSRLEVTRHDGRSHAHDSFTPEANYDTSPVIEAFVSLCAGEAPPNPADAIVGMRAVEVVEAMHRSQQSGMFEPVSPEPP